jgi:hypothetical protein
MKPFLLICILFIAYGIVGTIDIQDKQAVHHVKQI